MLLFLNHSVHVVTRYLTENSCVLLQTEAADLINVYFESAAGRTAYGKRLEFTSDWTLRLRCIRKEGPCNSGWNLQVIGLCECDVLGRIV